MASLLAYMLTLAEANSGGTSALLENRAGAISLVGILAVFVGLFLLMGFMRVLAFATGYRRPVPDSEAVPATNEEVGEPVVPELVEEDGELLPEPPVTKPLLVSAADLAAVQVARTLYGIGKFPVGREVEVLVDEEPKLVKLVAVGVATTAFVNGHKVIFYRSRTAGTTAG